MALPLRPYHPQRFIHQKLHPNPTKMFKHLQCEAHRIRSTVEVQHGSSPQAFNAKPTGPDQLLKFSMAVPLRPYHPQRFIHQKLHNNPTKVFKHLQCEPTGPDQPLRISMVRPLRPSMRSPWTRSAVEVQHGSSPQAIPPVALHPSEASPKSNKNVQASSMRSPPDEISR